MFMCHVQANSEYLTSTERNRRRELSRSTPAAAEARKDLAPTMEQAAAKLFQC